MALLSRTDRSVLARWWWTVDHWSVACVAVLIAAGVLLALAASRRWRIALGSNRFISFIDSSASSHRHSC